MLFIRLRMYFSIPSLLQVLSWMDVEFFQMIFMYQLIWLCVFNVNFKWLSNIEPVFIPTVNTLLCCTFLSVYCWIFFANILWGVFQFVYFLTSVHEEYYPVVYSVFVQSLSVFLIVLALENEFINYSFLFCRRYCGELILLFRKYLIMKLSGPRYFAG